MAKSIEAYVDNRGHLHMTPKSAVIGDSLPGDSGNATGETPPAPSQGLY